MPNLRPIELLLLAVALFVIVAAIYLIVRAASQAGVKAQTHPQVAAPAEPLEARLAELSDLRGRGIITEEEYHTARSSALNKG